MIDSRYKNLSESELNLADHYYETGNKEGLRQMQQKSANREPSKLSSGCLYQAHNRSEN